MGKRYFVPDAEGAIELRGYGRAREVASPSGRSWRHLWARGADDWFLALTQAELDRRAADEAAAAAARKAELKRAVDAERERRLSVGVDYDFGDARGVHRIGTTARDRAGWAEVDRIAAAARAAGAPGTAIAIRTDTGDTAIRADEWPALLLAVSTALQPVWQASWAVKDAVAAGDAADEAAVAAHAAWPAAPGA